MGQSTTSTTTVPPLTRSAWECRLGRSACGSWLACDSGRSVTADNSVVEGGNITYTATLTNPAQTAVTVSNVGAGLPAMAALG
ncbi:immunoglobulin-like domain-containing protein [Pseudomonas tolaasii]|uniref:immunoglobulin-like domain-containing protein n=1 Tax=Pseudomonas tolaasii TaxID=29442 RepID=UPI00300189AD